MKRILTLIGLLPMMFFSIAESSGNAEELNLPQAAKCYFDSANADDLAKMVSCFSENATVIDVGRRIEGIAAIEHWARTEVIGGRYKVKEIHPEEDNTFRLLVHFAPYKIGGFDAWYIFKIEDGKITQADLKYA